MNSIDKDAFLMIQRKKLTIYLNTKKNIRVHKLKIMVGCIMKTSPKNLRLYYKNLIMNEKKKLSYFVKSSSCLNPVPIGLALKMDNGEFEPLDIVPFPKLLPMKN